MTLRLVGVVRQGQVNRSPSQTWPLAASGQSNRQPTLHLAASYMTLSLVVDYGREQETTVSLSQISGFYPPFTHYFSIIVKRACMGYNAFYGKDGDDKS
jgi:hypothetical protein